MNKGSPIAYRLTPIYPAESGQMQTACLMECMASGKILSGGGGGGDFISPEVYELLREGKALPLLDQ